MRLGWVAVRCFLVAVADHLSFILRRRTEANVPLEKSIMIGIGGGIVD